MYNIIKKMSLKKKVVCMSIVFWSIICFSIINYDYNVPKNIGQISIEKKEQSHNNSLKNFKVGCSLNLSSQCCHPTREDKLSNLTESKYSKELKEKKIIINKLIVNDNKKFDRETIVNRLSTLPLKLLKTMEKDNLEIILSNQQPCNDKIITLGEYKYVIKRIYLYLNDYNGTCINHEIGHWFHDYITRKYDPKVVYRISSSMKEESKNIFNPNNFSYILKYMNSDRCEFFAEGFKQYIRCYKRINNCPIMNEYYDFYLNLIK